MPEKLKAIVIGSGGHARILVDIALKMNTIEIEGIVTNSSDKMFLGFDVLGDDSILPDLYEKGIRYVIIGIGGFTDNHLREKIYNKLNRFGFEPLNLIHPSAVIGDRVVFGKGVVLFAGVVINPDVIIGDNVVVATSSSIDHETVINDHCLISAGVTIGANVIIENGVLCALGSKVISQLRIGSESLIAAGSVVVSDVQSRTKIFGSLASLNYNH